MIEKRPYIRRELREVICPTCGKTFETYNRCGKYCSLHCYETRMKEAFSSVCEPDEIWLQAIKKRIGRNIKQLRLADGLSGNYLYHLTGITKTTIYGWEKGEFSPPLDKLLWLCKKTGWKLSDILSRGTTVRE